MPPWDPPDDASLLGNPWDRNDLNPAQPDLGKGLSDPDLDLGSKDPAAGPEGEDETEYEDVNELIEAVSEAFHRAGDLLMDLCTPASILVAPCSFDGDVTSLITGAPGAVGISVSVTGHFVYRVLGIPRTITLNDGTYLFRDIPTGGNITVELRWVLGTGTCDDYRAAGARPLTLGSAGSVDPSSLSFGPILLSVTGRPTPGAIGALITVNMDGTVLLPNCAMQWTIDVT